MDDYIHRKSLLEALEEQRMHAPDQSFKIALNTAEGIVEQQPAADVEEVRHGIWLESDPYPNGIRKFMCSCCSRTLLTRPEWDLLLRFPYCHCGAKMDLMEEKNEN